MYSTLETMKKILDQVKNIDGWHQGALYSPDGRRCCLMAHLYSLNEPELKNSVHGRLLEVCVALKEPPDVGRYNDTHSHAEVVSFVEKALLMESRACEYLKNVK